MATATSEVRVVEKTVTVDEEVVVLVLTKDEAETLYSITHRIGGDPVTSRRRHTDAIGNALMAADVHAVSIWTKNAQRAIYFDDEESD